MLTLNYKHADNLDNFLGYELIKHTYCIIDESEYGFLLSTILNYSKSK